MTTLKTAATRLRSSTGERHAQWTHALCVLFFFSGFPALIYQITWQRALFRIFGVNIESVTIVVTAFMLGLGIGSLVGGWLSKRGAVSLLPLLAGIEIATGAFGLVSLAIFERAGDLALGLSLPLTGAVTLTLVIVPTLLMGATLPVLVGHLARRSGSIGSSVGLLYYVNTLGAGAACLACTVLFFPFLGLQGAIYVAVGMNVAVAAGALAMHWADRRAACCTIDPPVTSVRMPALALAPVLALAAFGGFVSLSYEIFFFRTVSYASGSSATAFAATLSAFLVGLASGSRRAGEHCRHFSRAEAARRAAGGLLKANLLGLLFLPLLSQLAWLDRGVIGVAMVLVFLIARYWGALLPYLAELGIKADEQAGMNTAFLYLANILGSAAGSILTGFVLMEQMSLLAVGITLVIAGLLCLIGFVGALDMPRWQKWLRAGVVSAIAALALLAIPAFANRALENLQWKGAPGRPLVDVVENRSGMSIRTAQSMVTACMMADSIRISSTTAMASCAPMR